MMSTLAALGAIVVWFIYDPIQTALACQQLGEPLMACLLAN